MKNYYLTALLFLGFFLFSFSSENNLEVLQKKEISKSKINLQKKENTIQFKIQKLNFKEQLALKLVQKKIKKVQIKQAKTQNSEKRDGDGTTSIILISVLLILVGLVAGIVYLSLGQTLLGILLLLGGLIFVPLILLIILANQMVIC